MTLLFQIATRIQLKIPKLHRKVIKIVDLKLICHDRDKPEWFLKVALWNWTTNHFYPEKLCTQIIPFRMQKNQNSQLDDVDVLSLSRLTRIHSPRSDINPITECVNQNQHDSTATNQPKTTIKNSFLLNTITTKNPLLSGPPLDPSYLKLFNWVVMKEVTMQNYI